MKILLVGNYATDQQPSMARYAELLEREMTSRGHTVEILIPPAVFGKLIKKGSLHKWLGYVDKYLLFPWSLRQKSKAFALAHVCDHSNSVYMPWLASTAKSITCHDLLAIFSAKGQYPENRIKWSGKLQQRWIGKHLAQAANVACVSDNTAHELSMLGGNRERFVAVIYNPLNYRFSPANPEEVAAARRALGLQDTDPFLLHVGGNSWYKNRLGAIKIFEEFRRDPSVTEVRLVMAGKPFTTSMRSYIEERRLSHAVIESVLPSNETVRALYTDALGLLFPSLYEGFGWPILEAQSCGCAVFTTNRPPMTEVAGGAAVLFDPANAAEAAKKILSALPILAELRTAGYENLKRFDTKTLMDSYEVFFTDVVNRSSTPTSSTSRK